MPPTRDFPDRDIFTVSRLNSELRAVVDGSFPLLWVGGEISGISRPRSGHLYFCLKDAQAQIRCALFRNRRVLLRFQPKDGDQVVLRARLTLYEPRGDLQLIVEHLEPSGEGELRRAFEQLKARLQSEGLFDAARKRPLPVLPRRIGVVTSPGGAALRDILHVLRRRFPALPVLIYPVPVQGAGAAAEIAAALRLADRRRDCDLLILARAIAALDTPLISAVGHEIDFTIADFVADCRAPTPSAAAELATPEVDQLSTRLGRLRIALRRAAGGGLTRLRTRVLHAGRRLQLQRPQLRLSQQQQRLDEIELRLYRAQRRRLAVLAEHCRAARLRLHAQSPRHRIDRLRQRIAEQGRRLRVEIRSGLRRAAGRLEADARHLNAVSPLGVLERGFAVARRADRETVVRRADEVAVGESVEVLLAVGRLDCTVERRRLPEPETPA